jgi:hypothetical protein
LKFGIHIMRGVPRQAAHQATAIENSPWTARDIAHPNSICPWNTDMYGTEPEHPGTQDYYDSLFRLYAKWGVDFVKIDDLAASRLYGPHIGELKVIRTALGRCGRPMVLSLSPGPASLELAHSYRELAKAFGGTHMTYARANTKLRGRLAGLEQSAINRLTPYFERTGLIGLEAETC